MHHDTFKRLLKRAQDEKRWFSEVVEDVVKCGLLCLDESDKLEPKLRLVPKECSDEENTPN
jgi:hypothetical protein